MSTLGESAVFLSGGTPQKGVSEFWGGDIPWYSASNMDRRFLGDVEPRITEEGLRVGSRLAPEGSTLLLVRGSGLFNHIPICFADRPVAFNQDVKAIFPKDHVDPTFLHFWIENLRSKLEENLDVTGIGAGKFDLDFLKRLPFPNLPKPEQELIGYYASAFDRKIDLNRRMNETLEGMARAIFRDWFVDFGPTRAKIEGRAPYLAQDIWALFPDSLDDEGKPEGWEVSTIGNFIELLDHKRVPLSSQERAKRQGPYPYHGATSVMDHIDSYLFDEKLLLLGEDGSVAKADGRPFTQYVWGKLWVNNHAHVIKGRDVSVEQLKLFFDQIDIRPFVTGAVQPKLNQANLRRVPYLRAPQTIHLAFDTMIAPIYDLVRHQNEESRTLAATRDLLLPRLMSGEIRVKDAERLAEEAL